MNNCEQTVQIDLIFPLVFPYYHCTDVSNIITDRKDMYNGIMHKCFTQCAIFKRSDILFWASCQAEA